MERRAHQRRLHDTLFDQRSIERGSAETRHPRPQPHVRSWRPLGLEARDALHRLDDREPSPFEQELPGERGPIELSEREHAPAASGPAHPLTLPVPCDPESAGARAPWIRRGVSSPGHSAGERV